MTLLLSLELCFMVKNCSTMWLNTHAKSTQNPRNFGIHAAGGKIHFWSQDLSSLSLYVHKRRLCISFRPLRVAMHVRSHVSTHVSLVKSSHVSMY